MRARAVAAYGNAERASAETDRLTDLACFELGAFLEGWLGLMPEEYAQADLYAAAAVLVDRLGLRETANGLAWRMRALALGFSPETF